MQGSGLKEKKIKKSLFKESIHFVKNLRGKKSEKGSVEEQEVGTHLTQEQKEHLLPSKIPSDESPLDSTIYRRQTHASTSEPRYIKLSSGAVVDRPSKAPRALLDQVPSSIVSPPPPPQWNSSSSSSGFGVGLMANHQSQQWSSFEAKKPQGELDFEAISYDTLLKEARMLREDLETEYNRNRGSKEELESQITDAKIKIAEARSNKPSDRIYDDIIVQLSRELTELEKKVSEIESRMNPLDHTITDIQSVERFIKDRELDSQQASMLFETIMKKMFDDLSRGGGPSSIGEVPPIGVETMPKNVLNELQTKIQGQDWIPFDQGQDPKQRISTLDSNELMTKRKKLAREKFQRFSMKMDQVVEFSHKRTQNQEYRRSVAFRFNAIDRSDALRNPASFMTSKPPKSKLSEDEEASTISRSVFSDKTSKSNALQSIDGSLWLGYDQQKVQKLTGSVKAPSDRGESMRSSKSVADLQSLEHYPGVNLDASYSGDSRSQKTGPNPTLSDPGKPPLAPNTSKAEIVQEEGSFKESMTTNESLSEALSNIKLKKASDRPPASILDKKLEIPPMDLDEIDLGALADALTADNKPEPNQKTQINIPIPSQAKTEQKNQPNEDSKVKEDTKIKEKSEDKEKSEIPKPPPPPPKKAPPPPPPPGKKKPGAKGGPPPPPGGKKKTGEGLTRAPEVIAMFQEMRKALLGNAANSGGGGKKLGGGVADPGALMDELAKNSKYAAQVQADIEKYGDRIPQLITEVSTFEAKSMPDLIEFVKRVDSVLSELSDETAVLKQFDWPQRYYTMLEAKGVYEELERMKRTFSPWKKTENKAAAEIQKIQKFMDKSKTRVDVILRTKDADEKKFKDNKIPWNGKIFTEVKIASLSPLIVYMEVVLEEVESLLSSAPDEEGPIRKKALDKSLEHLRGAITFAFKVHQFAGGFTEACSSRFAEISTKTREIRNEISGTGGGGGGGGPIAIS